MESDGPFVLQNVPFETILAQQTFVTKYPDCLECLLIGEVNFGKYKLVNLNSVERTPVYLCDSHYDSLKSSKYIEHTQVSP